MTVYTLPDLPYDYSALEPHISGRIMELHHDKHHANYVAGTNAALEKLAAAREAGVVPYEREVRVKTNFYKPEADPNVQGEG